MWLQFLHEAFPHVRRIGVESGPVPLHDHEQRLQSAAVVLGVDLIIRKASGPQEIDSTVAALRSDGAQAMIVASDPLFSNEADKIAASAIRERLPTICEWKETARQGCLLSFGPNRVSLRRRTSELSLASSKAPIRRPCRSSNRIASSWRSICAQR